MPRFVSYAARAAMPRKNRPKKPPVKLTYFICPVCAANRLSRCFDAVLKNPPRMRARVQVCVGKGKGTQGQSGKPGAFIWQDEEDLTPEEIRNLAQMIVYPAYERLMKLAEEKAKPRVSSFTPRVQAVFHAPSLAATIHPTMAATIHPTIRKTT